MSKITPPFAWFGRYSLELSTALLLVVAALFRFWRLGDLPPGLYSGEAQVGLEALGLAQHGWLPALTAANDYAPLWIWLQAISVKVLGHTELALRFWPALLGIAAVIVTWFWIRDWFGPRVGWIAGFLLAVTPWSVTLSRNAMPTALIMLLVPLTLWVATRAYHRRTLGWNIALAGVITADLLAGPLGWLLAATVLILGAIRLAQRHELMKLDRPRLIGLAGLTVGFATLAYLVAVSTDALSKISQATGITQQLSTFADAFSRTLFMFNLRGDENFRHNFAAEPLLNAFVGLMFIAGVLVALSRAHERRYRIALLFLLVFLLPAMISVAGVPNAAHAVAALPIVMTLAAIGISYMLELWYATFPINSAARSTGQAVIILLLILSGFQGYAQYFRAWSGSSETYTAYNESAVAAARHVRQSQDVAEKYYIAAADELPVALYLNDGLRYTPIQPGQIAGQPLKTGVLKFVITAAARDEAAKSLSLKYPGGKLKPFVSPLSQNEIYYTYEVTK